MLPEFITEADLTTLAGWILLIVAVIWMKWNDLKSALARLYRDRHTDSSDWREATQDIQRAQLESDMQVRATQVGMEWYERKAAIQILKDQLAHSRDDITALQSNQDDIKQNQAKINTRLTRIEARLDNYLMLLTRIDEHVR